MEQKTEASQAVGERAELVAVGQKMANWLSAMGQSPLAYDSWRDTCRDFSLQWDAALKAQPAHEHQELTTTGFDRQIAQDLNIKAQPAPTEAPKWSQLPPTAQADYWHWNGSEDNSPNIVSVLYSPSGYFVASMSSHSGQAEMCHSYGGWWMRIEQPGLPGEEAQSNGTVIGYGTPPELVEAQGEDSARLDAEIEVSYELMQDDMVVASASGLGPLSLAGAEREIQHYAMVYAQDGPVEVYRVTRQRIDRARASAETGGVKS